MIVVVPFELEVLANWRSPIKRHSGGIIRYHLIWLLYTWSSTDILQAPSACLWAHACVLDLNLLVTWVTKNSMKELSGRDCFLFQSSQFQCWFPWKCNSGLYMQVLKQSSVVTLTSKAKVMASVHTGTWGTGTETHQRFQANPALLFQQQQWDIN